MFVLMQPACSPEDIDRVLGTLPKWDAIGRVSDRSSPRIIEILEAPPTLDRRAIERLPAVDRVLDEPADVVAACRVPPTATMTIPMRPHVTVGGRQLAIIAGPCSIEDEGRLRETAHVVAAAGGVALRGGAFKPRTAPCSFQGLGQRGLDILARVREHTGLAVVTEVMAIEQIEAVAAVADVLQVGSRNMHNTPLLRALGEQPKPVLLKRGWSATLEEFLAAAEYIRQAGNPRIILCERGIRTFEDYVRNTLALAIVPEVRRRSDLPIVVDPSHGTGRADLVGPMSRAAIACGADGLLVEVHPNPTRAWSDGEQTIDLAAFATLMDGLRKLAGACEREWPAGQSERQTQKTLAAHKRCTW